MKKPGAVKISKEADRMITEIASKTWRTKVAVMHMAIKSMYETYKKTGDLPDLNGDQDEQEEDFRSHALAPRAVSRGAQTGSVSESFTKIHKSAHNNTQMYIAAVRQSKNKASVA